MTDAFHRLTTPSYFTGGPTFPSDGGVSYDYINNGASGTPSFMDGAKVGGPNAGTYLFAFGDNATSENFNRGPKALAENCDHLDNLFHRTIAITVRTSTTTPVAPVTQIVLPAGTFLGTAGYTSSTADLNLLFSIVDANDNDIINQASGTTVQVVSVILGSGDVIGGSGANGNFSGNTVTLNISPAIPSSQPYRVYYGGRGNLATLPLDALTSVQIRDAQEISGSVENQFRLLQGNNLAWNASWTSTIYDLAGSGLNARYNRATTADFSFPESYWPGGLNSVGGGGWIKRTGPALTVYSSGDSHPFADPLNALFSAKNVDTSVTNSMGIVGYAAYGTRRSSTANADETTHSYVPGGASFMSVWPHDFSTTIHASNFYTRIPNGAAATLSSTGDANTGIATVHLTSSSNYFHNGTQTAIAVGYDLLEVTYTKGGNTIVHSFVITTLGLFTDSPLTPSRVDAQVKHLDGTIPDFSATSNASVRWISTTFAVGEGAGVYHQIKYSTSDAVLFDGLYYQVPPSLSTLTADNNVTRIPPRFSAQLNTKAFHALEWGGFVQDVPNAAGPFFPSALLGNGGIGVVGADITASGSLSSGGALVGNYVILNSIAPGSGVSTIGPLISGGPWTATFDAALGSYRYVAASTVTTSFTLRINVQHPRLGALLAFTLDNTSVTTATVTLDWTNNGTSTVTNRFFPGADQPPPGASRTLWLGIATSTTEVWWSASPLTATPFTPPEPQILTTSATLAAINNTQMALYTQNPSIGSTSSHTLKSTSPVPAEGSKIRVFLPASAGIFLGANVQFKREDGSVLTTVLGGCAQPTFVEFQFESGQWIIINAAVPSASWNPGGATNIFGGF